MLRSTLLAALLAPSAALGGLRVDISPDNGRKDVLTPHTENWIVPDGLPATATFGDIEATLSAAEGAFKGDWWKAGLDYNATFATDGVTCDGTIELQLAGLAPGRHTLATYHNTVAAQPGNAVAVDVSARGEPRGKATAQPSHRVTNDYDAATAFVTFDVAPEDAVINVQIRASDGPVTLNGFDLGTADPAKRAITPSPAQGDEHAPEQPVLRWSTHTPAAAYHLYLGTARDAVENATPESPEHQGKLIDPQFAPQNLNHMAEYFWRVDTIDREDNSIARGEVWRFRTRHLAFPGAEGYGRFARGGRGGRVIEVTNLDDAGPGSLRAAVEAEGPRTVVFRVGGTIELRSKLVIRNPYITIAGQTAPGDGIAVANYTYGALGAHDVIMRYMRIRVGDAAGQTMDGTGFASTDHAIFDHCSVSWSIDEAVSSRGAGNITFQRSIVAEALNVAGHAKYGQGKGHSFAGSISGNIGSFHHNLLAHCAGRNWSLAGGLSKGGKFAGFLDIRNNVVYNWEHRTNDGGVKALNLVGNYYIPGPATRVFHLLKPDVGTPQDRQQYYMAGNMMEGRPQYNANNWANGGSIVDAVALPEIRAEKPLFEPHVTTHSAKEAYESVMADVGANLPRHDAVDRRILEDVAQRKFTHKGSKTGLPGIIDSQADAGGFPTLRSGPAPADNDHDGMADSWERTRGLNPADPEDRNHMTKDGYTNLEAYLHWIVENRGLPES
jgi:hypothetical protein